MSELVPVRFSDCRCPGSPHDGQDGRDDGDIAFMRPFLDYVGGSDVLRAMRAAGGDVEQFDQFVGPVYIRRGFVGWNRLDAAGAPLDPPEDPATELPFEESYWLADKADDLYGKAILSPLVKRTSMSSNGGPTPPLTSVTPASPRKRRARSASSSPASSAGNGSTARTG